MELPLLAGFAAGGVVDQRTARLVAEAWSAGGLAALPTETVYGLAADAQDAVAVARIYQAKGRPADHPLIVHVADRSALAAWSAGPNHVADALAQAFWPGPLTLVVRRGRRAGDHITGAQDTVALRCPGHPVALACLRALTELTGDPARGVAAPSANRFGRVSPTSAADVLAELGDRLDPGSDLVVDGGTCGVGLESTIVDCTVVLAGRPRPRVLRPGAISQDQVDAVVAQLTTHGAAAVTSLPSHERDPAAAPRAGSGPRSIDPLTETGPHSWPAGALTRPRAPGMLDSHYAPAADVIVLTSGESPASLTLPGPFGLIATAEVATPAGCVRLAAPTTAEQYARELYAALRRADELGLLAVVAVLPPTDDRTLALAVTDRLRRAAHDSRGRTEPASTAAPDLDLE